MEGPRGGYRGWHRGQQMRGRGRGRRGRGGGKWSGEGLTGGNDAVKVSSAKLNFYCCSCERGFATQELLDSHNEEHIVCGLDGCMFQAHALVVTKHIRMQHDGDIFAKLKNLSTPEDIAKWREERRKNYPTAGRKQEKEDTEKEKEERREICGRKRGGRTGPTFRYKIEDYYDNSWECAHHLRMAAQNQGTSWMTRMYAPDADNKQDKVPFATMNKSPVVTLESFYMNVKVKEGRIQKDNKVRWKGFKVKKLDKLEDSEGEGEGEEIPISDEEDANEQTVTRSGLMLVDYSSEEEEGEVEEGQEMKNPTVSAPEPSELGHKEEDAGFVIQEFSEDPAFKKKRVWGRQQFRTNRNWLKNKLLETLLHEQIRKERNVILQTCRYLRENNFFDIT